MTILVTDTGFAADDVPLAFVPLGDAANDTPALHLASDTNLTDLPDRLAGVRAIRINFPSFADGRGFTLARQLRLMGFDGTLRAQGHVLADQYAMARRAGFDEVEISDDLAARQPEEDWLVRANWQAHDYQARLRG